MMQQPYWISLRFSIRAANIKIKTELLNIFTKLNSHQFGKFVIIRNSICSIRIRFDGVQTFEPRPYHVIDHFWTSA